MLKDINFVFKKEMVHILYDSSLGKTQNLPKNRMMKMERSKKDACKSAILSGFNMILIYFDTKYGSM